MPPRRRKAPTSPNAGRRKRCKKLDRRSLQSTDRPQPAPRSRVQKVKPRLHGGHVLGLVEATASGPVQPQHGGDADQAWIVQGVRGVGEVMVQNSDADVDADDNWIAVPVGLDRISRNWMQRDDAPVLGREFRDEAMAENSLTGDTDGGLLPLGMDLIERNTMQPNAAPVPGLVGEVESMGEICPTGDEDDDEEWDCLGLSRGILGELQNAVLADADDNWIAVGLDRLCGNVDEEVAENWPTGEGASDGLQLQEPLQPPRDAAADAEDAAWMQELVRILKENPHPSNAAPATGSAAPCNDGIEHINVGGYVMERDAYCFIRYDLGMPPPSLEPESPDSGEPLQLWSWDDSSFPRATERSAPAATPQVSPLQMQKEAT